MKRKFTTLLMLAFTFVSVSFLASCKDYEEGGVGGGAQQQTYEQLLKDMADLKGAIVDAKGSLNTQVGQGIVNIVNQYFRDSLQYYLDHPSAGGANPTIQNYIMNVINQQVGENNLDSLLKTMKNTINMLDSASKAHNGAIGILNGQVTTLTGDVDTIKGNIITLNNFADSISKITVLLENANVLLNGRIDSLVTVVNDIKNNYVTKTEFNALVTRVQTLETNFAAQSIRINKLDSITKNHDAILAGLKFGQDSLANALDSVSKHFETVLKDYATKQQLSDSISTLRTQLNTLISEREAYLQSQIDTLAGQQTVLNYVNALKAADKALQDKIDVIEGKITSLETKVKELSDAIDALSEKVDNLAKMVTGIEVQQVRNSVFGAINTPLGVNTNILMAYYGEVNDVRTFPVSGDGVDFSDVTPDVVEKGKIFQDGNTTAADAGMVLMTVNPSNIDFTGLAVNLANSQNEQSPVRMSKLAKSDETIKFGYTRANTNNYLYYSNAKIAAKDIDAASLNNRITVSKSEYAHNLKDVVKEAVNDRSVNKTALKDLAKQTFEIARSLELDAQGVTVRSEVNGVPRDITSGYQIAACAVKPLSFESLNALENIGHVPGYSKAYTLLDKINNKLHGLVQRVYDRFNEESVTQDVKGLVIKKIELEDLSEDLLAKFKISIDTTFNLGGKTVKFDVDTKAKINLVFDYNATADLGGIGILVPALNITGSGKGADLMVPIKEGDNYLMYKDGVYLAVPGDQISKYKSEGWTQVVGVFPQSDVKVEGTTDSTKVTIANGQTITVPIHINQIIETNITMKNLGFTIPDDGSFAFTFSYTIDLSGEIKELWGHVQNQIGGVNDMLDQVNKTVLDLQDLINDINDRQAKIDDKIDSYVDKVRNYLDKINNKLLGAIHKASKLAQPVMLINSSKGFGVLAGETTETGAVTLIPTTYSMGIVAPVCKKYVDINGVKIDCTGQISKFDATPYLKKGKNIVRYAALDYSGNEVNRQFVIWY